MLYDFESYLIHLTATEHNKLSISRAVDEEDPLLPIQKPRGYGGVATFWDQGLIRHITPHKIGSHRFCVITYESTNTRICIINCCMPCRGSYTEQDYRQSLDELSSICDTFPDHHIIMAGDFNADMLTQKNSRDTALQSFANEQHVGCPTGYPTEETFHHTNGSSRIDFILESEDNNYANNVVLHGLDPRNTGHHAYITADITIPYRDEPNDNPAVPPIHIKTRWEKCDLGIYQEYVSENVHHITTPGDIGSTDAAISTLTTLLHDAACLALPTINRHTRSGL